MSKLIQIYVGKEMVLDYPTLNSYYTDKQDFEGALSVCLKEGIRPTRIKVNERGFKVNKKHVDYILSK